MNDRRVAIFVLFAVVCAVLVPLTDRQFRWVPIATSLAYVVFAVVAAIDARSRARHAAARHTATRKAERGATTPGRRRDTPPGPRP